MPGFVRTGGVWKEPTNISVKTGGVWKDLTAGFVRTAGVWQQFYPSGPAPDPTLVLDLDFTTGTLDSKVTFTRSTLATYVNSSGLVASAAINAPRFDYDPVTLAPRGLLIEEQRTNIVLHSAAMTNAAWIPDGATPTSGTLAPDGTTTAVSLVESSGTSEHRFYQNITVANNPCVWSIYAKAGTRNWVSFRGAATGIANFNLATGTVGTVKAGYIASMVTYPNGWYRCIMSGQGGVPGFDYMIVNIGDADTGTGAGYTYAGNGTGNIYLWGAQFELGPFVTSYIPTTSAAVTRAADSAVMTGTNFSSWYSGTTGTFIVEGQQIRRDWAPIIGYAGGGTIFGRESSNIDRIFTDPYLLHTISGGFSFITSPYKIGIAYAPGDRALTGNGNAPSTDTTSLIVLTGLSIGYRSDEAVFVNGTIKRLSFYNVRKSNAELQALTAP